MKYNRLIVLLKYLLTVIIGVIVDYIFYSCFYYAFGLGVIISNSLSFIIGTCVNLILVRKFVFTNYKFTLLKDIILTLGSNGSVYFIGILFMYYLVEYQKLNHYLAKTLVMGLTFFINYFIRKYIFTVGGCNE
jgi:putative flippase GtrA